MNPMMEQRRQSKRQGETIVAVAVPATIPAVESTLGITKTDEAAAKSDPGTAIVGIGETKEVDPEITTTELIKSLSLSQLTVPYQHPPN